MGFDEIALAIAFASTSPNADCGASMEVSEGLADSACMTDKRGWWAAADDEDDDDATDGVKSLHGLCLQWGT